MLINLSLLDKTGNNSRIKLTIWIIKVNKFPVIDWIYLLKTKTSLKSLIKWNIILRSSIKIKAILKTLIKIAWNLFFFVIKFLINLINKNNNNPSFLKIYQKTIIIDTKVDNSHILKFPSIPTYTIIPLICSTHK